MDCVSIWERQLTNGEITSIYNSGNSGTWTPPPSPTGVDTCAIVYTRGDDAVIKSRGDNARIYKRGDCAVVS